MTNVFVVVASLSLKTSHGGEKRQSRCLNSTQAVSSIIQAGKKALESCVTNITERYQVQNVTSKKNTKRPY